MIRTCQECHAEKEIPAGVVCGKCRMAKSRARQQGEDATREDRVISQALLKKEKEDNEFRANALKILALVGRMRKRMLTEEVALIQAIFEPYTQARATVPRLTVDALARLLESGDLVDDASDDDEEEEENEGDTVPAVKVALTPSELRRDVTAALLAQGFKSVDISSACNRISWASGDLDQKLSAVLAILGPNPAMRESDTRPPAETKAAPGAVETAPKTAVSTLPPTTVKLALVRETPPGEYTVKVAVVDGLVDGYHLTLPPSLPQRVKQVSA